MLFHKQKLKWEMQHQQQTIGKNMLKLPFLKPQNAAPEKKKKSSSPTIPHFFTSQL